MGQVVSMSDHKKKKRRRGSFRWMRIILFCLVCALIGFGISQSPLFNVKQINVSGNENVDTAVIAELSGIKEGQHIYSLRTGRAETMIATNPWVESVKVSRKLPNTIDIVITERQAVAAVAAGDGVLIVDKEGYVLKKQELFDGLPYMLIIGVDDLFESEKDEEAAEEVEEIKPEGETAADDEKNSSEAAENTDTADSEAENSESEQSYKENSDSNQTEAETADRQAYAAVREYDDIICGEQLQSEKLSCGLQIAMEMAEAELKVVTQMNVLDAQNIIMDTVYGIKIYFGDENDTESKFEVVNTVLDEENTQGHVTKIKYIDVSVPSHPALRYNN
ncbi:MAG: cell division protein FtsQ/DivIB [Bacillota bacterium]|jgi:cell division septal protein FtsQ